MRMRFAQVRSSVPPSLVVEPFIPFLLITKQVPNFMQKCIEDNMERVVPKIERSFRGGQAKWVLSPQIAIFKCFEIGDMGAQHGSTIVRSTIRTNSRWKGVPISTNTYSDRIPCDFRGIILAHNDSKNIFYDRFDWLNDIIIIEKKQ